MEDERIEPEVAWPALDVTRSSGEAAAGTAESEGIKTQKTTDPPEWSLTASFTELACQTWFDLWDSYCFKELKNEVQVAETSITDYRLLALARRHPARIRIKKYSSVEEGKHTGADWVWWLGGDANWFGMRIQAKRLYLPSKRYEALKHKNGNPRSQIDTLINNAEDDKLYSAYCFYNALPKGETPTWNCKCIAPEPELLGCALADACGVQQIMIAKNDTDKWLDIEGICFPWHCLVACSKPKIDAPLADRARALAQRMRRKGIGNAQGIPRPVPALPQYAAKLLNPPKATAKGDLLPEDNPPADVAVVVVIQEIRE